MTVVHRLINSRTVCKTEGGCIWRIHVLLLQVRPAKLAGQKQTNLCSELRQVPPFLHGFDVHSLRSEIKCVMAYCEVNKGWKHR